MRLCGTKFGIGSLIYNFYSCNKVHLASAESEGARTLASHAVDVKYFYRARLRKTNTNSYNYNNGCARKYPNHNSKCILTNTKNAQLTVARNLVTNHLVLKVLG